VAAADFDLVDLLQFLTVRPSDGTKGALSRFLDDELHQM
jgi:hypothetical protein